MVGATAVSLLIVVSIGRALGQRGVGRVVAA
jgi:hypothetical protein